MTDATRKCYNCGPGTPTDHDERWLCERCSKLYAFNSSGGMIRNMPTEAEVSPPQLSVLAHFVIGGWRRDITGAAERTEAVCEGIELT